MCNMKRACQGRAREQGFGKDARLHTDYFAPLLFVYYCTLLLNSLNKGRTQYMIDDNEFAKAPMHTDGPIKLYVTQW